MILCARFVLPVDQPVIEDGAVVVDGTRVAAVDTAKAIRARFPDERDRHDFGDTVIGPGFINAHTHLELTECAEQIPPSHDFVDWLRRLMHDRTTNPPNAARVTRSIADGIRQSLAAGVTTIGDITRMPRLSRAALAASKVPIVSFGEIITIGSRRAELTAQIQTALDSNHASETLRIAISPHAPYTVEPEAMTTCAGAADDRAAPICVHIAETPEEAEFTRAATGPLADYLRERGLWDNEIPAAGCGPVELLARTDLLTSRTVLAHANYIDDRDVELIAAAGTSVAYCPRTHHAFGHQPHPFRALQAAGANVCIGTDSLASNPSLSVLDELRFLRTGYPDFPAEKLFAMGTIHGANALGWADQLGSIAEGKRADLAIIPLPDARATARWDSILTDDQPPRAVMLNGQLTTFD